jgi:hypothetical protein
LVGANCGVEEKREDTMLTYSEASDRHARGRNGLAKVARKTWLRCEVTGGEVTYIVRYHDTDIIKIHSDGSYTLNSGGFRTYTTKQRVNKLTPAHVRQTAFKWFVIAGGVGHDFVDGMKVDSTGWPIDEAQEETETANEGESRVFVGQIESVEASWGSGIATLVLKVDGKLRRVPCESGPLGRALRSAYPDAVSGHSINVDALKGKWIEYAIDDIGMMQGFNPAD